MSRDNSVGRPCLMAIMRIIPKLRFVHASERQSKTREKLVPRVPVRQLVGLHHPSHGNPRGRSGREVVGESPI
jgi:hypothetical protein